MIYAVLLGALWGIVLHDLKVRIYDPYRYRNFDIEKYIKENMIKTVLENGQTLYTIDVSKCPSMYVVEKLLKYKLPKETS